jgi:hypothetical protein
MAEHIDDGGPWSVCDRSEIRSGNLHLVAVVQHGLKQQSYASLIAAAPDMLAALQRAVACGMVPATSANDGGAAKYSEMVRVADAIRAAIAKATGVQHG